MKPHVHPTRRDCKGISLIEILVVIGVLSLLIALALPVVAKTRNKALATKNLSNIRQMGLGVSQYAAISKDSPPTFREPASSPQPWNFGWGPIGNGNWFEHNWLYSLAITAMLGETEFAQAAGRPAGSRVIRELNGQRASASDYVLSNTLYAHPRFFDWDSQAGVSQFAPQAFTSVSHPSSKGILSQNKLFHFREYGEVVACCVVDLPAPVVFADLSAAEFVMKRMPPGILNVWANVNVAPNSDPRTMPGLPVIDTHQGIWGRDR